jgi:4-amino-4-deoxy-L-arabinose transferase-like glycosyltransferase
MFKKYLTPILLIIISLLSVGLFLYKMNVSPPALNADEAANGYDAYSILKTGKDQYGNFMPLRFKSFGDYKLPLLTYLAVPFIKIFGLTETGIRMVNLPFVFLFPFVIYLLAQELFNKKNISLVAAFLSTFTLGLQLLGRQAHEGYMTAFFLTLLSYLFLKLLKKPKVTNYLFFFLTLLISLFGYHFSRLWAGFYFLAFIFFAFKKSLSKWSLLFFIGVILLFGLTDAIYQPTRIKSLLFFNNPGFIDKTSELQFEGGSRLIYNKLTVGVKDVFFESLKYFSPQFLVINGDENPRFGYPGASPITVVEYFFVFVGVYFLFKNKEKWRYLILLMLFFSPLSGSLSWAGVSITRSVFIFIPLILISAYGMVNFTSKKSGFIYAIVIGSYLVFLFLSWDFYLNHYPKRPIVIRSWQAGYKELAAYINKNYQKYDKFYITQKNGQPYIYLLFYLKYPPEKYQKLANLSGPDKFGFGQVEGFDKYHFSINPGTKEKKSVLVGYPDDFSDAERPTLKRIKVGTETIFYIKEIN